MMMNIELERRKEFERRKKLRLLQVRQQSKEFADNLRERIKGEINKQKERYLESENKLKQEKHLQELRQLKELYDRCLGSVGEGHKEAAKQPDLILEKESERVKISTKANERGVRALKKHLEAETIQKQKTEAPIKQKKAIRKKENLRACYIASLPNYAENDVPRSVSTKISHQNTEPQETRRVLEEIPSNLTGPRVRYSEKSKSPEKSSVFRKDLTSKERRQPIISRSPDIVKTSNIREDGILNETSPRDCSCDYIVCACHQSPRQLRRCSSESRISEKDFDFQEPKRKELRSRSCSPRSVRTLNYFECGNVYESNQPSCVRVTHHSRSPQKTDKELVSNTEQEDPDPRPSVEELKKKEELKKRTDERCAKALRREKLKRDFQQLIENLKKLTKEKSLLSIKTKGKPRVYASERDILKRKETKQKKLNDAFENLPLSLKSRKTKSTGVCKPEHISSDDSSPPTLNLALCQTNMSRRVVDFNIASKPPPPVSNNGRRNSPKSAQSDSYADSNRLNPTQVCSPPQVLVDKDPSGDVYITVKVNEPPCSQPVCETPCPESDSSYMSPPMNLTPSQQQLLNALLCQVNKKGIGIEMKMYIEKLLNMSRESIDKLYKDDSRYEVRKDPRRARSDHKVGSKNRPKSPAVDPEIQREFAKLNELAEIYAKKVNTLVDMYEQMTPPLSPSTPEYVDPPCIPHRPPCEVLSYIDMCYTPPSPRCEDPCTRHAQTCDDPCKSPSSPNVDQVLDPKDSSSPSAGPTPRTIQSGSPTPRQGVCYGQDTPSSGYGNIYQPPCTPCLPSSTSEARKPKDPCGPSVGPTPRTIQSGSPTPRQGVCYGQDTPSSGYGNIYQPPCTPCPPTPTPMHIQESYCYPEKPTNEYQNSNLLSYGQLESPHMAPSKSSKSRANVERLGRISRDHSNPPIYSRDNTPTLPPEGLVRPHFIKRHPRAAPELSQTLPHGQPTLQGFHPTQTLPPDNLQGFPPTQTLPPDNLQGFPLTQTLGPDPLQGSRQPFSKYPDHIHQPPRIPTSTQYQHCPPHFPEMPKSHEQSTQRAVVGFQTISESQEYNPCDSSYGSSSLGDSTLDLIFGGIPGVPVPSKSELERRAAVAACVNLGYESQPEDFDLMAYFNEKQEKILRAGEQPDRQLTSPENMIECDDGNQEGKALGTGFDMSALKHLVNPERLIQMREQLASRFDKLVEDIQRDKQNADPCDSNDKSKTEERRSRKDDPCRTPSSDRNSPTRSKEHGLDPGQKKKCQDKSERKIPTLTSSLPPDLSNIQNLMILADSQDRFERKTC